MLFDESMGSKAKDVAELKAGVHGFKRPKEVLNQAGGALEPSLYGSSGRAQPAGIVQN